MGKIERRVLGAALLGAIAMLAVVGFGRSEHAETPPPRAVPVAVDSPYRATSWVVVGPQTVGVSAKSDLTPSFPDPIGGSGNS
jgi:hypothetical protein